MPRLKNGPSGHVFGILACIPFISEELLSIMEAADTKEEFIILPEYKKTINKRLYQIKSGKTKTHEEVQGKLNNWLFK